VSTYALLLRPRLEIDQDQVRVIAPLGRLQFPLDDVTHASGGNVLRLSLRSGESVRVIAVTNTNVTLLLHRRGRTEHVASEINELLEASRQ
jgi:hypothetical protein